MTVSTKPPLPERFAIFPLAGALLLPGGNLPLNVFEPRYRSMTRDALDGPRVIGMVQPAAEDLEPPPVFATGCAGRITSCAETEDGRYLITLTGVSRFDVVEELAVATPYRQVRASFARWHCDADPPPPPASLHGELVEALRAYLALHAVTVEWEAVAQAPLAGLITSLAMICPFAVGEKQALLEAATLEQQGRMLVALLRMETMTGGRRPAGPTH